MVVVPEMSEMQGRVVAVRTERGFTTEPVKLVALLAEEVGEIASEVKKLWSPNYDGFDADRLAAELADTFALLAALAAEADIDLERAVEKKFFVEDGRREWRSAAGPTQGAE